MRGSSVQRAASLTLPSPSNKPMKRTSALTLLILVLSTPLLAQLVPPSGGGGRGTVPANFGSGSDCNASGLLCNRTVSLTPTDVLALNAGPFTVVPAPGAGKVAFPVSLRWRVHGGTHPWVNTGDSAGTYLWWGAVGNPFGEISAGLDGFLPDPYVNTPNLVLTFATGSTPTPDAAAFTSGFGIQPDRFRGVDPAQYDNLPLVLGSATNETLNRGPVLSVAPSDAGADYIVGEQVAPDSHGMPNDCLWTVTSVNGSGGVTGIANTTPGTNCPGGMALPTTSQGAPIVSATVSSGLGGNGYTIGDTGLVGDTGGAYAVTGATDGVVTSVMLTNPGQSYFTGAGYGTTVTSGGGDGGLALDLVAALPGTGLTANTTVQHGDGTLTVTIWYTVADK